MKSRVLLGGLLGGLAMYVWMSVAHVLLPIGATGVQEIPNDAALLDALHAKLGSASGLYMYPSTGAPPDATFSQKNAAMAGYEKKLAANPSGLLIYHPPGMLPMTPSQLITEFVTELIEALLVAWLLAQTSLAGYVSRLGFCLVCGVLSSLGTNMSYWNWYGFPTNYTVAYILTQIVGILFAGLVIAKLVRTRAA